MMEEETEQRSDQNDTPEVSEEFRQELERGDSQFEKGRYRAAVQSWIQLLESKDTEPKSTEEQQLIRARIARAYYERAQLSIRARAPIKSLRRGLARIEEALQWDPDNAHYLFEAARCHWRLEEVDQARELFERAAQSRDATPKMRYYAALVNIYTDRPTQAAELLSEHAPADQDHLRLQAYATAAAGHPVRAIRLLMNSTPLSERTVDDIQVIATSATPSLELCQSVEEAFQSLGNLSKTMRGVLARLLGDMYSLCSQDDNALAWWKRAYDLTQEIEDANRICWVCELRALAALKERQYEEGLQWCAHALTVSPQNSVIMELQNGLQLLTAQTEWEKGDVQEAASLWRNLSDSGSSIDAAWNQAVASERANETPEVISEWIEVSKLARERQENEIAHQALLRAALLSWRLGELDQSRSLIEQACSINANNPTANRLLVLAALVSDAGKGMVTALERAHGATPDDPLINLALAAAHDASDAPLESKIDRWQTALAIADDQEWVQDAWRKRTLEMGLTAWQQGELDRAMAIFSKVLLANRFDPDGWIWCGTIHLQLGKEDLASVCFEKALATDPSSTHTFLKIGGCYLMSGREDEAHEYFSKAQEVDPEPVTNLRIAEVCIEIGRKEIAFKHLSEAIERSQSHSPELYRIAQLLFQVGEGHTLRPLLQKIASVIDKPYRMHYLIAVEQIWASLWQESQETLETVQEAAQTHGESDLLSDVRHAERTMILLLTTGDVNPAESRERVQQATHRWVLEGSPPEDDRPITRLRQSAQAEMEETVNTLLSSSPDPRGVPNDTFEARLQISLPEFGKALDLTHLLPTTIDPITPPALIHS